MALTWRNLLNRQALDVPRSRAPGDALRRALGMRASAFNVVIALMAILIFGATFRTGINRGMDQLVGWNGYGRALNAITVVMTEEWFHVGGYALSNCIHTDLESRGFTADPETAKRLGVSVPENLRAVFLDKLLADMQRDLSKLPDYCGAAIRGIGADDVGYVDFAKIAFALFGHHVRAFYYLFFWLYGLTLLCALLERKNDPVAQSVLIGVAALIYVSCYYSDFLEPEPTGSGNMLSVRFIPVLALIPGIHLLLILADTTPPNWWRVVIVIFQSVMILFAIHIRASAAWWILTFILAALALSVLPLTGARKKEDRGRRITYRSIAAQWPVLIAVVIILVGTKAIAASLHPVYREGGWLQHHAMWHSIYYSLQYHPKYLEKYDAYHDKQHEDQMPIAAAMAYLKEHPEEDRPDLYVAGKSLKNSEVERFVRLALFDFVRRDPRFIFETFSIIKPKMIINAIIHETTLEWHQAGWRGRLLFMVAMILIGGTAAGSSIDRQRLSRFIGVFTMGAIGSLLVPLLTVPIAQVIPDEIIAIQISTALVMSIGFAYVAHASAQLFLVSTDRPVVNPA